ncbi:MAG: response regulator [Magnetococcales bacterium]|nr:response regulator [Magnetococcales bacterium]
MKPLLKLPAKIVLLTLIFTLLGVALVGYVSLSSVEKLLKEQSFSDIASELRRKSNLYVLHIHELHNTLSVLADSSSVLHALAESDATTGPLPERMNPVANDFMAIMEHQPTYTQISLLGMAQQGRERVRVERRADGQIVRVAEASLQAEGGQPFFPQTMRLNPDQFTLLGPLPSPETTAGAAPADTTWRMAVPVFTGDDECIGILTIREDFHQLTDTLFRQTSGIVQILMTDSGGNILYFPEKTAKILQEGAARASHAPSARPSHDAENVQAYFPGVDLAFARPAKVPPLRHRTPLFADTPVQASLPDRGIDLMFQRIYFDPSQPARYLVMIAVASNALSVQRAQHYWQDILELSLAVALGLGLLIILATRQLTLPMRHLTRTIQRIAAGEERVVISVVGTDEVSELAAAFQTLLSTLHASHVALKNLAASLEMQVRERTADLAVARDEALAASQAKSDFLATMSHEIRTPMTVILGMLELLRTSDINLPDRERVELALGAGNTLLTLINNVLDFSRMETEQFTLDKVDFDLRQPIYEASMTVAPLAHAKGIELTAFFPDVPLTAARGDPIRLRQVLVNLLGNAVKFTPEGGVVELYGGPVDSDGEHIDLLFEVRDSGIGVALEDQEKIFSRFTQVDSSSTRRHEGTGLGLSICKHLVEMMGGEINMEPNPHTPSGSVFYFTVQLDKQQQAYIQSAKKQDFKDMRVLAIAHDGLLRTLVEDALVPHGARLDHVAEVEHAANILQQAEAMGQPYQLVLCNQRPVVSHRREFRQLLSCNADLRFILLTDLLDQGWDQATELPGTAICLKKPINADRLVAAVEWLIKNKGSHHALQTDLAPLLPEALHCAGSLLIVDDQQANVIVTQGMLINIGYRPDQISTAINGVEALEIFKKKQFDLILMDCQMPVMNGFDATRAIHLLEQEQGRQAVPIIAFTADITPQARDNIRACGMDGFLSKPVTIADLRGQLRQFSLLRPSQPAVSAPVEATVEQGEAALAGDTPPERVDMEALLKSMRSIGLQDEDFREVADLLAVQFLELLTAMQRDVDQSSYQSARATAHVIKGSMANTIFPILQKSTRALYEAVRDEHWAEARQELAQVRRLYRPIQEALLAFLGREG